MDNKHSSKRAAIFAAIFTLVLAFSAFLASLVPGSDSFFPVFASLVFFVIFLTWLLKQEFDVVEDCLWDIWYYLIRCLRFLNPLRFFHKKPT
jgi:hypothetical protein